MNRKPNFELKADDNGKNNPKYVDVLDEDRTIAGQKFVCLSFLSPENILKEKKEFLFEKFVNKWEISKSLDKFTQFLHFISYKHNLDQALIQDDLQEFVKTEKDALYNYNVSDDYKSFIEKNEDELNAEFSEIHAYQTNSRGIKVRGSYPTIQEAELRCKMLREADPNHDVYVGQVGVWMPFHPEAYNTGRVEYLEEELNQLMHEKNKNEACAKKEFDNRVQDAKRTAIEDNIEKASISGNVLTQTINKQGDLIDVKGASEEDTELSNEVISANIRKELFDSENVVRDKNSDHGLQDVLENLEKHKSAEVLQGYLRSKLVRDSTDK